MDLSIQEKIELILNYYTSYGYIKETIEDFPEAIKFITLGGTCLDDKNGIYKITETGRIILHECIKQISKDFIAFFKDNGNVLSEKDMNAWFIKSFSLDEDTGKEIAKYISNNLSNYGYIARWSHSSKFGERFVFEKNKNS